MMAMILYRPTVNLASCKQPTAAYVYTPSEETQTFVVVYTQVMRIHNNDNKALLYTYLSYIKSYRYSN